MSYGPLFYGLKKKSFIFLVFEMKIDNSFPIQQFSMDGYKIYGRARNSSDGGLLLCVNENIPCRELTAK